MRSHPFLAAFAGALLLLWSGSAPAADPGAVAADVLSNPDYQSDFPGSQAQDPNASLPSIDGEGQSKPETTPDPAPEPEAPATPETMPDESSGGWNWGGGAGGLDLSYLPLVVMVGVFLILAIFLLSRISFAKLAAAKKETAKPEKAQMVRATVVPASAPEPVLPPGPLDDAERLAAEGRYSEAIHLVLLRFLSELRYWADLSIADSLTSREILRKNTLPATTREALGVVIGAVELCHFGGRRGDATLFRHCADAYLRAANARSTVMPGAA